MILEKLGVILVFALIFIVPIILFLAYLWWSAGKENHPLASLPSAEQQQALAKGLIVSEIIFGDGDPFD